MKKRRSKESEKLLIEDGEGGNETQPTIDSSSTNESRRIRQTQSRQSSSSKRRFNSHSNINSNSNSKSRSMHMKERKERMEVPDMDWAVMERKLGSSRSLDAQSETESESEVESNAGAKFNSDSGDRNQQTGVPDMDWTSHYVDNTDSNRGSSNGSDSNSDGNHIRDTGCKDDKSNKASNRKEMKTVLSSSALAGKQCKKQQRQQENTKMRKAVSTQNLSSKKGIAKMSTKAAPSPLISPLLQVMAMNSNFLGAGALAAPVKAPPAADIKNQKSSNSTSKRKLAKKSSEEENEMKDRSSCNGDHHDYNQGDKEGSLSRQRTSPTSTEKRAIRRSQTTDDAKLPSQRRQRNKQTPPTPTLSKIDSANRKSPRPLRADRAMKSPMRSFTADDITLRRRKRAQDLMSPKSATGSLRKTKTRELKSPSTANNMRKLRAQSVAGLVMSHPTNTNDDESLDHGFAQGRFRRQLRQAAEGNNTTLNALVTPGRSRRKAAVKSPFQTDRNDNGAPTRLGGSERSTRTCLSRPSLLDFNDDDDRHDHVLMTSQSQRIFTSSSKMTSSARTDSTNPLATLSDSDEEINVMSQSERINPLSLRSNQRGIGQRHSRRKDTKMQSQQHSPKKSTRAQSLQSLGSIPRSESLRSMERDDRPLLLDGDDDVASVTSNASTTSSSRRRSQSSTRSGRYGYSNEEKLTLSAIPSTPKKSVGLAALLYCKPLDLSGGDNDENFDALNAVTVIEKGSKNHGRKENVSPLSVTDPIGESSDREEKVDKVQTATKEEKVDKVQAKKDYWKAKLAGAGKSGEKPSGNRIRRRVSMV